MGLAKERQATDFGRAYRTPDPSPLNAQNPPREERIHLERLERVLGSSLQLSGVVVLDNLPVQKASGLAELAEVRGARLLYLPPYLPDFAPIELPQVSSICICARRPPVPARF